MPRARRTKELDRLDYAILALLREDARRPNHALARELGVSHVTVRERIDRLLADGYLRLLPIASPSAFGYEREVEILLNLEPQLAWSLAQELGADPAVRRVAIVTGGVDLIANAVFRSEGDLYAFLRRLAERPGVRAMQTQHVVQVYGREHDWLPVPADSGPVAKGPAPPALAEMGTLDPTFLASLRLAGGWLVALIEADVAQLAALSEPEIVFDVLPPTPLSGRYVGVEALIRHAQEIRRRFPISSAHIVRARPAESRDELFVRWDATAVQEDGAVQHGRRLMHATVRGERLLRVTDGRAETAESADRDRWLTTE